MGDGFGSSVSSAGDVNGDGFADLVVGSAQADPGGRRDAGSASVYWGSRAGILTTPLLLEGVAPEDSFGRSVASAGDVNGDGFGDLVVGAPFADTGGRTNAGTASVYLGNTTGAFVVPQRILQGVGADDWFGQSVASAGDVNGDGFGDLVIGAQFADPMGRMNAGTASLYLGSVSGTMALPQRVLEGIIPGDFFGYSVASAGDVNGDGFADLVVGAWLASPAGRLNAGSSMVYLGSAAGVIALPHRVLDGMMAGDFFGSSVAGAGDINSDGFSDLAVASLADSGGRRDSGAVAVYLGSTSGVGPMFSRILEGTAADDFFGHSVASAGDVNGDGFADLVVGAPGASPSGRSSAGAATLYLGSATGVSTMPHRVLDGASMGDRFGSSVASAVDVNTRHSRRGHDRALLVLRSAVCITGRT